MPNPHALIIDDQRPNIDVLALLLEQEGVSTAGVTSARDVFETLDRLERIDVVFLDLEMPNSDSYALLRALKADARLASVPIIAYTVHLSEIDTARQIGFDGFLGKPLQTTEFPNQIKRILNGEAVWAY